ncbi:UDP-N-acetyl-D-mannosaminuronate dehydrogenase [hydrothermal vent metagenome]|uniref:UDP-N-acetyl-D-mannosaminuronate dehydrogenase n=1 Tax=hydrothermal vent metagenome TaxID=652676 RepID=A0A3B0XTT6_9ZZZZ
MKKICIQGLGFVGAAMATAVANAKETDGSPCFDVVGVDLPTEFGQYRVDKISQGEFPFSTSDQNLLSAFTRACKQENLSATTNVEIYAEADIIIVDIQLDIPYLDNEPQLQLESFRQAIETIGRSVQEGTLIIVETTVPPGTCEKVVVPILEQELQKRDMNAKSIHVAHSYERVMPGDDYLASIIDYWRVFAGHTQEAGDFCEEFLSKVINVKDYPLTRLSSTTASETAKVMENSYRAANIAFIDEWTKFSEAVGIDLFEVVAAIKKRPTHSNIRYPGLGVGGYCLTKDPTFAPAAARQLFNENLDFPFSELTVRVNDNMPLHTVNRLKTLLSGNLKDKHILVCGISYRQDVGDTRYSPSEKLVRQLIDDGANIKLHDPYVEHWDEMNISIPKEFSIDYDYDAVVFAVPHKIYQEINLADEVVNKRTVILDANGVLRKSQCDSARENGLRVESIGRGNSQL